MQAPRQRHSVGKMPYRARHAGLCAQERRDEVKLWGLILAMIGVVGNMPPGPNMQAAVAVIAGIVAAALAIRTVILPLYAPINKVNRERGVMSFSEND